MAKFSKTIQHDYMRFKATFADGGVLSANYSRGGDTIGYDPYDPETARLVSNAFLNIKRAQREGKFNLGQLFELVEPTAKNSDNIESFVSSLTKAVRDTYDVDISMEITLPQRSATTVTVGKKGRSLTLDVKFENGEDFSLSLAGRSVGYNMQPPHSLLMSKVSGMALGLLSVHQPTDLLARLKEAAEDAPDIETWIENIQNGYRPASKAEPSGMKP